jgi:hypothetical protein
VAAPANGHSGIGDVMTNIRVFLETDMIFGTQQATLERTA